MGNQIELVVIDFAAPKWAEKIIIRSRGARAPVPRSWQRQW